MNIQSLAIAAALSLLPLLPAKGYAQIVSAKVSGGEIQGEVADGVASFKGIPFAAPPVGPLRWRPPQTVKPWDGVRKVTAFAPSPMQNAFVAALLRVPLKFSEDCLYLNVCGGRQ